MKGVEVSFGPFNSLTCVSLHNICHLPLPFLRWFYTWLLMILRFAEKENSGGILQVLLFESPFNIDPLYDELTEPSEDKGG